MLDAQTASPTLSKEGFPEDGVPGLDDDALCECMA